ncbi:hypothetical protein D047_3621A, partial [Vibrio parahaemolyticus VPTS-2010_2]
MLRAICEQLLLNE